MTRDPGPARSSSPSQAAWLRGSLSGVTVVSIIGTIMIVAIANLTWISSKYYGHGYAQPALVKDVGVVPVAASAAPTVKVSPNRIEIPKLRQQAPIVKVGTTPDGELDVPQNPKVIGWWSPGAKPGAKKGTAIFAGHINYNGVTGTFARIGELRPGDQILVYGQHGTTRTEVVFRVTGVRTYHKTRLPYQQIFDQQSIGRMAMVTCGGPFDASTGNYLDNIVTFAVPVSSRTL